MPAIVTFGEIMGRLCPEGYLRFAQSIPGRLEWTFGGAEANVAVSLATLGAEARFVTALPEHAIADACVTQLRGLGVDTSRIVRQKFGRLGLYFVEKGANQRPSNVIYDRAHSTIACTTHRDYDWSAALDGAGWLHLSGITPAISALAFESTMMAATEARKRNLRVSCDLNFRKKLWQWQEGSPAKELAEKCMRQLLPMVSLVIANEEDASDVLSIEIKGNEIQSGQLAINRYPEVAKEIVRQFPNVSQVAITLRESHSASNNDWGAMLYESKDQEAFFAPMSNGVYSPYSISNIVDRVGGGDSFAAGLIFALQSPRWSQPADAIRFAVAASCLAHSIEGDFNFTTLAEVEKLAKGNASGRVER